MKDKINIKQGLLIFIALVITSVVVASFLGTEIAFFIEKQVAKNNIEADVTIVIPEELHKNRVEWLFWSDPNLLRRDPELVTIAQVTLLLEGYELGSSGEKKNGVTGSWNIETDLSYRRFLIDNSMTYLLDVLPKIDPIKDVNDVIVDDTITVEILSDGTLIWGECLDYVELPPPQEWGIPTNYRLTSSVYLVG